MSSDDCAASKRTFLIFPGSALLFQKAHDQMLNHIIAQHKILLLCRDKFRSSLPPDQQETTRSGLSETMRRLFLRARKPGMFLFFPRFGWAAKESVVSIDLLLGKLITQSTHGSKALCDGNARGRDCVITGWQIWQRQDQWLNEVGGADVCLLAEERRGSQKRQSTINTVCKDFIAGRSGCSYRRFDRDA